MRRVIAAKEKKAMSCPHAIRQDLEKLPDRMLSLPIDERGYVVPWFVDWIDGKPEFRAMDPRKWTEAVRFKKCWVCGNRLGRWMTFVAGPMCGINRTSSEPPSHLECARWSSRNCPFLSNSQMVRREDADFNPESRCIGGFALNRNPGVAMLWTTDHYDIFSDGKGGRLLHMGEPNTVEWWANGKMATREEVMRSIDTGLPSLEVIAQQQNGAMEYLLECRERFMKFVPEA